MNCAVGQPCLYPPREEGADIVYRWLSDEGFDHFNVRWSSPGHQAAQVELDKNARVYRVRGARRNTLYQFSVQGCHKPLVGSSRCSPWASVSYLTCGAVSKPCGFPPGAPIIQRGGGLCLDVHAPTQDRNGTHVQVWRCNNSLQQRWFVRDAIWSEIRTGVGKCLDVHVPDLRRNGGRVQVWDCNGSVQQRWSYRDGRIQSAGGKCLDVHAPDMRRNGGRVQVWDCNRTPQQHWSIPRPID